MPEETNKTHPTMYQIRVKGWLDPRWRDWFDGFEIFPKEDETLLVGPVEDQAGLQGLLAKIYDLGIMLLSLNIIENNSDASE